MLFRSLVERTALALLDYIEASTDGFRILVRDSPVAQATGTFSSLIGDVSTQVEHLLGEQFTRQGLDPKTAPIYARMLVGMVALTGQHWLDSRSPAKTRSSPMRTGSVTVAPPSLSAAIVAATQSPTWKDTAQFEGRSGWSGPLGTIPATARALAALVPRQNSV